MDSDFLKVPELVAPYAVFPCAIFAFGQVYNGLVPSTPGYEVVSWGLCIAISLSLCLFFCQCVLGWPAFAEREHRHEARKPVKGRQRS
jgi:hypothetical protein